MTGQPFVLPRVPAEGPHPACAPPRDADRTPSGTSAPTAYGARPAWRRTQGRADRLKPRTAARACTARARAALCPARLEWLPSDLPHVPVPRQTCPTLGTVSTPPFLDLPVTVRAHRVITKRGDFAVLEGMPPAGCEVRGTAVLMPGFTGGKEDFIGLLDPLARRGYRTVAVDQRGQNETPGPPHDSAAYERGALVADLWSVHDTLLPGERPHLVGHSFGGLVARSAAIEDAARLSSLTLMSSGPAAIRDAETARLLVLEGALAGLSLREVWDAMRRADRRGDGTAHPDPALDAYLRDRWLANSPAGLAAAARQLRTEPDLTDLLGARVAAGLRVLVVSGARDYAWPVAWQRDTARRLGVPYVAVDGAGHSPNAERPEATARALADFWDAAR